MKTGIDSRIPIAIIPFQPNAGIPFVCGAIPASGDNNLISHWALYSVTDKGYNFSFEKTI